jgi:hypothetical protein
MNEMSPNEKLPKNNLFKLTCRDGHDNPNYTFTWELTPEGAAILQEKEVRLPFMYVFAVEEVPPKKVESHREGCGCEYCAGHNRVVEEHLSCLHEGAGQIQFHRQGTFRIYAMVIWYPEYKNSTWNLQRSWVRDRIDRYRSAIVEGVGELDQCSLQHVEEDAVNITGTFFASKPNPTLWWWANLWWENKPRNSCDYKKRLWFVLWFQLITVSIYAFLRGLLIGLCYLGLLLVGFRPSSFSFRPMFHAFSSVLKQMCDFESKTCNYALQNSAGKNRTKIQDILVRLPIFWIAASILLTYWGRSIYHNPKVWMWAVILLVGLVAAIAGLYLLTEKIRSQRKSRPVYYEMVLIEKPKKRRVTPKVRWLDAKGKYCLPFPE